MGNIFIDKVAFHFKFIELYLGFFNFSSVGKGIGKGVNEICPKAFITFGNRVTPLYSFFPKDVGLFLHPIIYFVAIKESQEVGAPLIGVFHMRIVLIVHLE